MYSNVKRSLIIDIEHRLFLYDNRVGVGGGGCWLKYGQTRKVPKAYARPQIQMNTK